MTESIPEIVASIGSAVGPSPGESIEVIARADHVQGKTERRSKNRHTAPPVGV